MELMKEEDIIRKIKEDRIDRIFYEKLARIEELYRELGGELEMTRKKLAPYDEEIEFYSPEGHRLFFRASYEDRTREGSPVQVYNMSYSLLGAGEDLKAEANIYIGSSCKCCTSPEAQIRFPEGQDIAHYIIVEELNHLIGDLEARLEDN